MPRFPIVLLVCFALRLAVSEEVKLPITADNSICCCDGEQQDNLGQSARIKMKGIENILILNSDFTPLKNKLVAKAVLHIKATEKNVMVRKVGFSTIATPWNEGKSLANKDGDGTLGGDKDSCYKSAGNESWAGPGSSFLDAIWGHGGTFWMQSYVKHDDEMWFTMEFDGRILEACAAGLSSGVAVSDDNGQTKNIHKDVMGDGNFSNNFFFAREQNNAQPYFTAELADAQKPAFVLLPVSVKSWPAGADFQTGGLEISWPGPKTAEEQQQVLGYRIKLAVAGGEMKELPRWVHPAPAVLGETARALLRCQTPEAEVKAEVEIVGRGGVVSAKGQGAGKVSSAFAEPPKLAFATVGAAPAAPPANAAAAVWAVPDCLKVNPLTGNCMEEKNVSYLGAPVGAYDQSNPVWSGANRLITLNALRGEWVAFQLVCQNKGNEPVTYKITPGALHRPGEIPASAFALARVWYQKLKPDAKHAGDNTALNENGEEANKRSWYADPLLPLEAGAAFTVPDAKNAVPGQKIQTVYVEFFVPKEARSGIYSGTLEVSAGEAAPLGLNLRLTVGRGVIPDKEHFIWSMNAYNSPGGTYGAAGSEPYLAAERSFYVTSHIHRTCLAVLHYSHGGRHYDNAELPLAGRGKEMKVADWSAWDSRFGPLFDGSAFKGTPREGLPIDHFYLMLSEHYPMSMAAGYKWNDATWEDHWKVAGPIAEGFSQEYQDAWVAVAKDHLKHFKEKGYKTDFQIYLNDKYFYKQYTNDNKGHAGIGNGVCFWLLDEPMHIDDFDALAFFGKLLRQAQEGVRQPLLFRVDVSRPQWGRDTLDRVVDLNVSGGFNNFRPWLEDWRERYGQRVWTYGGAPGSTKSALGIEAQGLSLYSQGVDGFVPWLALGGEKNWAQFEATCVFYTGKPMGIQGACASLRLKAYRRAEQDVEYVWLLANQLGLLRNDPNRRQVAELLKGAIQSTKKLGLLDSQGAVTESFGDLRAEDFDRLRQAIAARLK